MFALSLIRSKVFFRVRFSTFRYKSIAPILFRPSVICFNTRYSACRCFATKNLENLFEENLTPKELREEFKEKVIYHSFYKADSFQLKKFKENKQRALAYKTNIRSNLIPVSLKYFISEEDRHLLPEEKPNENVEKSDKQLPEDKVVLPYEVSKVRDSIDDEEISSLSEVMENQQFIDVDYEKNDVNDVIKDNICASSSWWMADYANYKEKENKDEVGDEYSNLSKYGTPNLAVPMSKVPCGGCGALLHCQDPGIPGYLPSEIFCRCTLHDLRGITCQRCHFMQHYKMSLAVTVDPGHYPLLLSRIRNEKALVILMVDMTDFPCSIWPGILDIIGPKRPLFVVGNKIDLLYGKDKGWVQRAKDALDATLPQKANIKYTTLISAKTGFGVESLINKLHNEWQYRGDVYLVGCTNVGKSTLFNALLQSDYCKVQAVDLLQRATTAPWPGTTLNLLKFPILRPSGMRLFLRTKRLQQDRMQEAVETKLKRIQSAGKGIKEPVQLVGHIGRTFPNLNDDEEYNDDDPFSVSGRANQRLKRRKQLGYGLDPDDPAYKDSKWLYDTPGVVQPDQIIDLLTTEELILTLPRTVINHRVYLIKPKWTIFIAGLGRLDFVNGDEKIRVVIFCPQSLPITICETIEADNLYREYVGTPMLAVPTGGPERMKFWPNLKAADEIVLKGISIEQSCGDIVLSNAGWISVVPGKDEICKFRAWTPDARGVHVRIEPVLPFAVQDRGKRIHKTPSYAQDRIK